MNNPKLTPKKALEGFKQIDYKILTMDTLKKLHHDLTLYYLRYDEDTNSHYFETGISEFNNLLEEFDEWFYNDKNKCVVCGSELDDFDNCDDLNHNKDDNNINCNEVENK